MKTFDINEYKKYPGRKLVLRHYRKDLPEVWAIEEAQLTIGDRLVIKVPETGYDTDEYLLPDDDREVRDKSGNLVGTVEFAVEAMPIETFADRLFQLQENETIDFSCADTEDECQFGATKIRRFDSSLVILAAYGGKNSHLHDITGDRNSGELCESIRQFLRDYLSDSIYIDLCLEKTEETAITETFQEKTDALRRKIIQSIVKILESNGLQRMELSTSLENPTYVVWNEPQENVFYDTPVSTVSIDGSSDICMEVEEPENGFMETLYSRRGDLACMHPDWLIGLRDDILNTVKLQQNEH